MTKTTFIVAAIVVAMLAAGLVSFIRAPSSQAPTEVRVGYNVESVNYAPLMIAAELKYFQLRGVTVRLIPLQGGNEVRQALVAGQVDLGLGGAANFFPPIAKGAPVRIIAPVALSPTYLFVRPSDRRWSFGDLIGKVVAVNAGGSSDLAVRQALHREGVDISAVRFSDLDRALWPTALVGKRAVDAIGANEQDVELLQRAGAVVLDAWADKGYIRELMPRTVIAANTEFLNEHQPLVEKFLLSLIDAHRLMQRDLGQAASLVAQHIKAGTDGAIEHNPEEIVASWQSGRLQYALWYDPTKLAEVARIYQEIGELDVALTADEILDRRFELMLNQAHVELYGQPT